MKKWVWLMITLGPMVCLAQADGKAVPADSARAMEGRLRSGSSPPGKFELTLEQLRDRLALKAQQQALWSAYADKVSAYTDVFYREKPVLASQESTAPHQVARLVDNMQNRLAALEDVEVAAKNLFASLSPDQQKIANQLLIATLPSLASNTPDATEDGKRKPGKPEGATRSHRGGGGGMGGGMGGG